MNTPEIPAPAHQRDWGIFWSSAFFVLGFASVFSLVGVLLQTVLLSVSYSVQVWLGRVGGVIVILFGLVILGIIKIGFLQAEHKFRVRKNLGPRYFTAFVFGAAFAVGWTPCVSAALGAILALASTQAGSAFFLLFAYTLGIGLPFLVVGAFSTRAQSWIDRAGSWLVYVQKLFGLILVALGVLIFVGQLSRIANLEVVSNFLSHLGLTASFGGGIQSFNFVNLIIAFAAGLGSFLSPCILPLVPSFLAYLASSGVKSGNQNQENVASH